MRLLSILAALLLLAPTFAYAAPRAATPAGKTAPKAARTAVPQARTAAVDYNCLDFVTRDELMKVFLGAGGPKNDPYRLDGDKDGIPCEDLR